MSKSARRPASSILLVEPPDDIHKKVRSAVTDSGRDIRAGDDKPALTNLLGIFALVDGSSLDALEERFAGAGYGDFKAALADALVDHLAPIRARYLELLDDRAELERIIVGGAERAAEVASATMRAVRSAVGLPPESRLGHTVRG